MALVGLSLRRPYTIAVLSLLILLLGALSASRMIVDFFPRIDIPIVSVGWQYSGLSAEEMERRVVIISERAYSTTVAGIERIESTCIPGIGLVKVYFHPGMDIGAAISQINAINGTILRILPPGISPPVIVKYNPASLPIVNMTFFSKTLPEGRIFDHAFNFVRVKLFTVPGMQVPAPFGGKLRQISVDLSPTLMQAKGVSPNDVIQTLQTSNLLIPSGTARIGTTDYNVLMNSSPPTVEEFNRMPLKIVNDVPVLMGDVAKVEDGFAVQNNIVHVDGRRATYLTILKHADASSLAVVEATRKLLPEIQAAAPEGMEISLDFDQSKFVRAAIRNVTFEAVLASLLVSLMILVFLGSWRNTIVVITSIPCAMFAGIICLYLTDNTINLMTLSGLALATGILVDDATVAVENIHRHRALGQPLTVAILEGSREVAMPRTMATLAICIVFSPVAFLYGVSKYLFTPLALAVVFSLLASYILSFTLVPMLSRFLLEGEHHDDGTAPKTFGQRFNHARERVLDGLINFYGSVLAVILHHRVFVVVMMVVIGGASALLVRVVGSDFFPAADVGIMKLHFRAPVGTRIEETEKLVLRVNDEIRKVIPEQEVDRINNMVGVPLFFNLTMVPTDNISGMDADVLILLKKPHKPVAHYMKEIRAKVAPQFPGSTFYFQNADIVTQALNFGLPAPIDIQIQDSNFERAQKYASRVKLALEHIPGTVDARQMQVLDYPALRVDVDRLRAARMGLTQRDVATSALVSLSSSAIISPSYFLNPNGVNYTVSVQTPQERISTVEELLATPITPMSSSMVVTNSVQPTQQQGGNTITLGNVATVKPESSYQSVSHYTVQRVIDVAANIEGRDLGGTVTDIQKKIDEITAEPDFPKTTKIVVRGQYEVMQASFTSMLLGLVLAIVLVYALLVILFQSWTDPFIIMMAVPGALIGILWMLSLTGTTLNVMSLMGAIMAVGIGVANSILIVSFANELRAARPAMSPIDAAIEAAKTRLRPVVMTALAMIIGMMPMALGLGEAGEQNAPLGRAVIGGLIMATISTLVVVPVIYSLLRKKMPVLHRLDERFDAESRGERFDY
ncbi:MAG: efflux RND transporter permease subunit [Betaproteobacteria bacterium]|nr:efflux RND transporter permease subunit [Betaproteobacteria bacterium]